MGGAPEQPICKVVPEQYLSSAETGLRADCSIWIKATSCVAGYYLGRFLIWTISTRAAMTQADGQQPIAEHTITSG
jgi:hypothetical protein